MPGNFYSHGKLLITGEYLVLDGALSLALPVNYGQNMSVEASESKGIYWRARQGTETWFEAHFATPGFTVQETSDPAIAENLKKILLAIQVLQPSFILTAENSDITTTLEFNRDWGFGSSSTLLCNLARWAEVDPYELLWSVATGSGYDIACADAKGPVLYRLKDKKPLIQALPFAPSFHECLYFAYLGKKQNSISGIETFRAKYSTPHPADISEISSITESILTASSLSEFIQLMNRHESVISRLIGIVPVGETRFRNFPGGVKSLGAWGGDFVMIATDLSPDNLKKELDIRSINIFFSFDDLILNPMNIRL